MPQVRETKEVRQRRPCKPGTSHGPAQPDQHRGNAPEVHDLGARPESDRKGSGPLRAAGLLALFLTASPAFADDVALGLREGYTLTDARWEWGGPVLREGPSTPANRYATVRAQGVKAWVTTVTLDAAWRRWLLNGEAALGPVVNGTLAHSSGNSWFNWSRSWISDGDARAARVLVGYRLLEQRALDLDALLGASYRRDQFKAFGAVGWPLGTISLDNNPVPAGEPVATERTTWVSALVVVRASVRLTDDLVLTGEAHGTPWSWVRFEEARARRSDLQPRATNGEALGGWGAGARLGAEYRLVGGLRLTGGLAYDSLQSGASWGWHFNPATPDCRQPRCQPVRFQMRTTTQSWGPYLGLDYRW